MKRLIRAGMVRLLLVSLLFTQSGMLQASGAVIFPENNTMQIILDNKKKTDAKATLSNANISDNELLWEESIREEIATLSDADNSDDSVWNKEPDIPGASDNNSESLAGERIATVSNAYALSSIAEVWDGMAEQEVLPRNDVYDIRIPAELAWVKRVTNDGTESFAGKTIFIRNDLDMGGFEWEGIGTFDNPFKGNVEGNGCTISNIKQEKQTSSMGLFGAIVVQDKLSINNLIIANTDFRGNAKFAGVLSGYIKLNSGTKLSISNIETSGTLEVSGCCFGGGLAGNIYSPGNSSISIKEVKTSGDMTVNYSALNNTTTNTGGLIGAFDSKYGNIKVNKSSSSMNISTTAKSSSFLYTGGIFGGGIGNQIEFNMVYATGALNGKSDKECIGGGLIGYCETDILNISNSYMASRMEIRGGNGICGGGGLVGFLKCRTSYKDSFFRNCHIAGNIKSVNYAAFIMHNDSETESVNMESCYYNRDGLMLKNANDKITHLGFFKTIRLDCPNGQGIAAYEMGDESSFVDWDFDNIWTIQGSGYPELQENAIVYGGLIVGMDPEEIWYSDLKETFETEELDLHYSYSIDEDAISEEWVPEIVLAQVKITLPEGFSFSKDEVITELYVNDGEAPLDYVYVLPDGVKSGTVKVFVNKKLTPQESFPVEISIHATGFETFSSHADMIVVIKEERPSHVPENAVYNKFNGHWYYYYEDICSWDEASNKCKEKSGYLVTITSWEEQSFVETMLDGMVSNNVVFNNAWIGLYNLSGWQWVSGELFQYNKWDKIETDKLSGEFLQGVLLKDYKWDSLKDGQCAFICEWESKVYGESEVDRPVYVPEEAVYNEENGHWYQYFSEKCTWQEAKTKCEQNLGYLVTITSEDEKFFVEKNLVNKSEDFDSNSWIGLYYQDEWKWITGERKKYQNWSEKKIQNTDNLKYAVMTEDLSWNAVGDRECSFICEWGNVLDLPQKFPESYDLPVLDEKNARNLLGFIFNKSEISKMDLTDDELFRFMTGKIEDPEQQFYAAETLLVTVDSQISKHINKSSQARKYLLTSLESFMNKQLGGMKDIPEKEYNKFYNSQMANVKEYVNDFLIAMTGKYLNIHITESTMENINLAFSTYKKVAGLPKKIEKFVESAVAVVQTSFLPLQDELNGRYNYFNSYLSTREIFDRKDQAFRTTMDFQKGMLLEDNFWNWILNLIPGIESWDKMVPVIENWAEYIYQLQLALNEIQDNCTFVEGNYKSISIQCPVNIYIEDTNDRVVAKIEADTVVNNDEENLFLAKLGDAKLICIKSIDDYKLRMVAAAEGEMSYICKDIRNHNEVQRVNYYQLPLSYDNEYISNGRMDDEYEKLNIVRNGIVMEEIASDEIIKREEKTCQVHVEIEGQGFVSGYGVFTKGDYVYLNAYPSEEWTFSGWKQNGKVVSENTIYDFTLLTETYLVACFSKIDDSDINHGETDDLISFNRKGSSGGHENADINSYPYLTSLQTHVFSGIWRKDIRGWWLQLSDGIGYAKNQWAFLEEKWYLFDNNGYMITGWAKVVGKWYYLYKDGSMATGWVLVDNKWYYLNSDGSMAVGWVFVNNKWYYLSQDGSMLFGTVTPDGYKVGSDGAWIS